MEFPDGSNPSNALTMQFISLCEKELSKGRAVAVHCRAGLGRTGTLIGLYLMAKYDVDARAAIAWLRLCRPGSVVGNQQQFMAEIEESGELDRLLVEPLQNKPRRDKDMYDKYFSRKENKTEARQYTRDLLMDREYDARDEYSRID